MRIILPLLLLFVVASCDPTVNIQYDQRDALLRATRWKWMFTDTVYVSNNHVVYISRAPADSCEEVFILGKSHDLEIRDSCGSAAANVYRGAWSWMQNYPLQLQVAGQYPALINFRYTPDTLQFARTDVVPSDSVAGQPVYAVRTYARLN